jgi:hypothetical protein
LGERQRQLIAFSCWAEERSSVGTYGPWKLIKISRERSPAGEGGIET